MSWSLAAKTQPIDIRFEAGMEFIYWHLKHITRCFASPLRQIISPGNFGCSLHLHFSPSLQITLLVSICYYFLFFVFLKYLIYSKQKFFFLQIKQANPKRFGSTSQVFIIKPSHQPFLNIFPISLSSINYKLKAAGRHFRATNNTLHNILNF